MRGSPVAGVPVTGIHDPRPATRDPRLTTQDARATTHDPLAPCVHCGFCLPACPTYLATGDESDSPRGRIVLMRALESGELDARDGALIQHLDACLGCRGCEPVCPSGVAYGRGLEIARARLVKERGLSPLARLVLAVFRRKVVWRVGFGMARWMRDRTAGADGTGRTGGRLRFALDMLAATRPAAPGRPAPLVRPARPVSATVALFRGCVMDALFSHVHEAVRRTLEVNGYRVVTVPGQQCCGALHDHAGDVASAKALAAGNVRVLAGQADFIAVDSAGCGAILKDYGHLLGTDAAVALAGRVRDVTELLAEAGPVEGAPIDRDVVYDAPCHLQHAQRVHAAPLAVLGAIPGLRVRILPGSDKCCGSAGIYSLLEPEMSRAVLAMKIEEIAEADPRPAAVVTGNPGCLMQIGAGLRAAGLDIRVVHPVELLDEAYGAAGLYER